MGMENLTSSDTTQQAEEGEYRIIKGSGYIYVKAATALTAYQLVTVASAGTAGPTTYSGTYPVQAVVRSVAIPQFDIGSGEWGWAAAGPFFLKWDDSSNFYVSALTLCALDVVLYSTGTAGAVDDTSSSQAQIQGLYLLSTVGGATANTACMATKKLTVNS